MYVSPPLPLQAHMPEGGEVGEEEERNLLKAFEEVQYLIEDLDHANSGSRV